MWKEFDEFEIVEPSKPEENWERKRVSKQYEQMKRLHNADPKNKIKWEDD